MKIKFSDSLEYQKEAIDSIVNVFEGQSMAKSNFTVSIQKQNVGFLKMNLV